MLAGRGDLMASEQGVPIPKQLSIFKEMIQVYLDQIHLEI